MPKRPTKSATKRTQKKLSAETVTLADLLTITKPPRKDTTAAHLTAVGPNYVITIQGPESRWLAARTLEFIEALHETHSE